MSTSFLYDVFFSFCAMDKPVVEKIAQRMQWDGLRVWLAEAVSHSTESEAAGTAVALANSRVMVLCMSSFMFAEHWTAIEPLSFRFRDPLSNERRFIPLRLDNTPVIDSLAQFMYIDWRDPEDGKQYNMLLTACLPPETFNTYEQDIAAARLERQSFSLGHTDGIHSVAFSPDGRFFLSGSADNTLRLWDSASRECLRVLEGHTDSVRCIAVSKDGRYALSGSHDQTVCVWEIKNGRRLRAFKASTGNICTVAWHPNGQYFLSGATDACISIWSMEDVQCVQVLRGHTGGVLSACWNPAGTLIASGSSDDTVRLWDVASGQCLQTLTGHANTVNTVSWHPDGHRLLSGADDNTVRLWRSQDGQCLRELWGHQKGVECVAWSPDGRQALSGSRDGMICQWNMPSGRLTRQMRGHAGCVLGLSWHPDGLRALSGSVDTTIRIWDVKAGDCLSVIEGQGGKIQCLSWAPGHVSIATGTGTELRIWEGRTGRCHTRLSGHFRHILAIAWAPDGRDIVTGSEDMNVRIWNTKGRLSPRILRNHHGPVNSVACHPDGSFLVSGSEDGSLRYWALPDGRYEAVTEGHSGAVEVISFSPYGWYIAAGSADNTIRLWRTKESLPLQTFTGHSGKVLSLSWSADGAYLLSGAADRTIRLWDVDSGSCLRVMEGHTGGVTSIAWNADGVHALSGDSEGHVRLWDTHNGQCECLLERHTRQLLCVDWSEDGRFAFSATSNGVWHSWDIAAVKARLKRPSATSSTQVQYTNAKVLLVGDSGVGKTGLSNYLALGIKDGENNVSTDGAWATQWKLPYKNGKRDLEREIWLWDFAGQVDYRLVHQLFMDDTAAAVLVFNPQHENPFEGLGQWERDLQKASRRQFSKLLAAGRVDRGGLVVSTSSMAKFIEERGFLSPMHLTSAKTGEGCDGLCAAIVRAIRWENVPPTTSPVLYRRMKQEILAMRDSHHVLIRLAELKQRMELAITGQYFEPGELTTVVDLLAGPGIIQRLDFGGFILLKPEVLSRYAAAVVRKVRKHPQELGCIPEDDLLNGALDYQDFERLPAEDEKVILCALHETFVSRAWCLREAGDKGRLLIFPSYFRRERPEQANHPQVMINYRFNGPIDEIYSTLVVRLHHTTAFETEQLWKFAADFKTQNGKGLGFKLVREAEGAAQLNVYFSTEVDENTQLVFLRYIHDHLTAHAKDVVRLRNYVCSNRDCGRPFTDRALIDELLAAGKPGKLYCPKCGEPTLLRDVIEQKFDSSDILQKTIVEQDLSQLHIDNESRELLAVHHTGFIVSEAGQIYRGYTNSDHGIDAEIEFKDDNGRASGRRLYLQLKSGDSYLVTRQRDGADIFRFKNERWPIYWQQQAYPVLLVIRRSNGEIHWMDISDYLKHAPERNKPVKQVVFSGERLDVMSVLRWREKMLK